MRDFEDIGQKLDESFSAREFSDNDFDVDQYYEPSDAHLKVRVARHYLDEIIGDVVNPKVESVVSMPW